MRSIPELLSTIAGLEQIQPIDGKKYCIQNELLAIFLFICNDIRASLILKRRQSMKIPTSAHNTRENKVKLNRRSLHLEITKSIDSRFGLDLT